MQITLNRATESDRAGCVAVEASAMKGHRYLDDVWEYFESIPGELICAKSDGQAVGIGRFSVLPDGSGWLETLRVREEYQGKGIGKAIYDRYFELAREYSCPSMAMYTGVNNVVSASLARRYGLEKAMEFRGYVLEGELSGEAGSFKPISDGRGAARAMAAAGRYNSYLSTNRTFYRTNEANLAEMERLGWCYEDADGNFIMVGARFQPKLALHILMIDGDFERCFSFARHLCEQRGLKRLVCTFSKPNDALEQALVSAGFEREKSDLMTMEIKLK